ncbi:MAG TPA: type II secretion system protein [Candidatus Sumerlaeota bacterium]|nr:type II secretion system protein [Candidatus Sumerlaeota bacterium]HPS00247.1 type II secretion system protein [Candidatus Sumerlaeota bacterium]
MMIRSAQRGFTFVEILVAMVFMAILVPIAVEALLIANRAGSVAHHKRQAALLASNLLTEMVVTDEWVNGQRSGDLSDQYTNYRWELETSSWSEDSNASLVILTMRVYYTVQGQEYSVNVSTLAPEGGSSSSESDSSSTGSSSSSGSGSSS